MPQKPFKVGKKIEKKQAANRHGKAALTRKGKFEKPPKKGKALESYKESQELTKAINATNESMFAAKAQQAGGKLKALKAAPPALAPKDKQKQAKAPAKMEEEEDE